MFKMYSINLSFWRKSSASGFSFLGMPSLFFSISSTSTAEEETTWLNSAGLISSLPPDSEDDPPSPPRKLEEVEDPEASHWWKRSEVTDFLAVLGTTLGDGSVANMSSSSSSMTSLEVTSTFSKRKANAWMGSSAAVLSTCWLEGPDALMILTLWDSFSGCSSLTSAQWAENRAKRVISKYVSKKGLWYIIL